jgi:hypothetical protein
VNLQFLHERRWWLVFLGVGLILNGLAVLNSDIGLDVHVRLNVANDESTSGADYPWGPTRWVEGDVQTPVSSGEYDGYIGPWYTSQFAVGLTSFIGIVVLSLLAGYVPSWRRDGYNGTFNPMWSGLVAWSPCLMFATGRGYDEAILAIILGLSTSWLWFVDGTKIRQLRFGILMMATSVMCVLGWKGFSPVTSLLAWLLVLGCGMLWLMIDEYVSRSYESPATQQPWLMSFAFFMSTLVGISIVGGLGYGGTFSIIQGNLMTFLLSLAFAFLDGIVLFLLVGFCLWPFFSSKSAFWNVRGRVVTMVAVFCSVIAAGIVAYIGALWTLESNLWDISLFQCILILGNNGRYATILVLPVLMLIHLCQHIGEEPLRPEQTFRDLPAKPLFVTMLLLLPLVMFTGFHGQQLWQEDAGNALAGVTSEGNSSFLLIADSTLAMHSLYVLKTEADLSGELNISGYWRTPSDALSFLNTTSVDAVILAPGVVFEMTDGLWVSHEAQASPFTLSSWGSSDGWVLYLPS